MKREGFRKVLVFGVVFCFFGVSVFLGISGNLMSKKKDVINSFIMGKFSSKNIDFEGNIDDEYFKISDEISSSQKEEILDNYESLSMYFTENKGQFPEDVLFQIHTCGATIYLCRNKTVSILTKTVENEDTVENMHKQRFQPFEKAGRKMISVVASFEGASENVKVNGEKLLPHYNNYFIGNESSKWVTHVLNYKEVVYHEIYPGIDLHYYTRNGVLKYDFVVHSGADPSLIRIRYDGVEDV
ncbi:MAG TPA: hypothetical protein ENI53_00005, partial [Thermoplasmatales archaeon]|nr:hypothetical protein [Thermoplasmatales archaeon]